MNKLKALLGFDPKTTTVKTELIAGMTTFLTMCYILAVNPTILATTGMDKGALFTATAIASAIATFLYSEESPIRHFCRYRYVYRLYRFEECGHHYCQCGYFRAARQVYTSQHPGSHQHPALRLSDGEKSEGLPVYRHHHLYLDWYSDGRNPVL